MACQQSTDQLDGISLWHKFQVVQLSSRQTASDYRNENDKNENDKNVERTTDDEKRRSVDISTVIIANEPRA